MKKMILILPLFIATIIFSQATSDTLAENVSIEKSSSELETIPVYKDQTIQGEPVNFIDQNDDYTITEIDRNERLAKVKVFLKWKNFSGFVPLEFIEHELPKESLEGKLFHFPYYQDSLLSIFKGTILASDTDFEIIENDPKQFRIKYCGQEYFVPTKYSKGFPCVFPEVLITMTVKNAVMS